MNKFTKAPWYNNGKSNFIFSEEGKAIAHISLLFYPEEEYKANARLISAAPEMYDELYTALDFFKKEEFYSDEAKAYVKSIAELLARIDGEAEHE